ncbi:hypothetical protein CBS101457_004097 [Exobasidium rhododendri]|nr:hypothetical protein CBS101457_004097 [Exobasidium rhododendri]
MVPSTTRHSPTLLDTQSHHHSSASLSSLAASIEIPTNAELTQLVTQLQERKSRLTQRRINLIADEKELTSEERWKGDSGSNSLLEVLDKAEGRSTPARTISSSPIAKSTDLGPESLVKGRSVNDTIGPSSSPVAASSHDAFAQPAGPSRAKVKVKREADQEREENDAGTTNASTSQVALRDNTEATRARQGSEASATLDADWDEEGPSRPGRSFQIKRKRQKISQSRDQDDQFSSGISSPQPSVSHRASPQIEPTTNSRAVGGGLLGKGSSSAPSSIKLKLNPTAHSTLVRNDTLNSSLRRPSVLRGKDDFGSAMTPMQASQAALWELPARSSESFIPKPPVPKLIRWYPTRPEEVDVDYSTMDWKEREKERDRIEAAAGINGPGPGQAIVKESTTASRAKDKKHEQISHTTFLQNTDAWFRTVTEEDLGYLLMERDSSEALQIPPLGRHYSEVWAEEEANGVQVPTTYIAKSASVVGVTEPSVATSHATGAIAATSSHGGPGVSSHANGASTASTNGDGTTVASSVPRSHDSLSKLDARVSDEASLDDALAGPFTERLLAALLPANVSIDPASDSHASEAGMTNNDNHDQQGKHSNISNNDTNSNDTDNLLLSTGANHPNMTNTTTTNEVSSNNFPTAASTTTATTAAAATIIGPQQSISEYEERIRAELKAIGLVEEEETDWSQRADDEISSTLRKVQRLLEKQIQINGQRKARLYPIAKDRLAYQGFLACVFSTDREIEVGWTKRQNQIKKSMTAQLKKKKGTTLNGSANANATLPVLNGLIGSDGPSSSSPAPGAGGGTSTPGGGTATAANMASSSSAMGYVPTATDRGGGPMAPQYSDTLLAAVERRRLLKYAFGPIFDIKPRATFTPMGDDSIYKDID